MATPNDHAHAFQSPRGTRDFYPLELARRRWIENKWRTTAVRHGFDEIDGPTFEHLDLYTVKSGDGIVSELFSFTRQGGETRFALRPEFTPTLARMAAARANALPKPTKWFSIGPYFRAERPQRGRLREFLQWNVDVIGDDSPEADAECIAACIGLLEQVGFTPEDAQIRIYDRRVLETMLVVGLGISPTKIEKWFNWIDRREKYSKKERVESALDFADNEQQVLDVETILGGPTTKEELDKLRREAQDRNLGALAEQAGEAGQQLVQEHLLQAAEQFGRTLSELASLGLSDWVVADPSIVRGLAYYTGTVFEVHEATGAERAIAGGGRYDNLIELFGGPPTPAVGFAMGDVVLSLVLQDKGLMPSDEQIASDLGLRPDAFVIPTAETEHLVKPLVARLRREGMHVRHTHKSTRNVGKLLKEAGNAHARYALILESDSVCSIKNLDANEQADNVPIEEAIARIAPPGRS
jgi:histidyl-tRNA synthetase